MRIQCPSCRRMSKLSDDIVLTRQKGFELQCPKCESHIKLYLLSGSKKDSFAQSSPDPFGDQEEQFKLASADIEKQTGVLALKSKILRNLIDLPPMPHIILKAQEVMEDPTSSLKNLAAVIETDQAIVARVLTLANSAYYGISGMVSSIQHASVLLGQKTLRDLITISASSRLLSKKLKGYDVEPEDLWKHSLAVALGAKSVVKKVNPELLDDAFLAGLLHDAGKIILDPYIFERKKEFDEFFKSEGQTFLKAEQVILGFDHAEIMSRATRFWRFPETQSTAIRFHHYPSLSEDHQLAYIVHVADYVAKSAGFRTDMDESSPDLEQDALGFLGIREVEIETLMTEVTESVDKMEAEFQKQIP
jgi:HD-like signal output (HDOD) protein